MANMRWRKKAYRELSEKSDTSSYLTEYELIRGTGGLQQTWHITEKEHNVQIGDTYGRCAVSMLSLREGLVRFDRAFESFDDAARFVRDYVNKRAEE